MPSKSHSTGVLWKGRLMKDWLLTVSIIPYSLCPGTKRAKELLFEDPNKLTVQGPKTDRKVEFTRLSISVLTKFPCTIRPP